MRVGNIKGPGGRERDVSRTELQRWKQFLDGLPDLRFGKLEASRAALAGDRYDDEAILDETAKRIFNEIGHRSSASQGAS